MLEDTLQSSDGKWLIRISKLLNHLEKICGLNWKSNHYVEVATPEPSLIVIQDSWLLLNETKRRNKLAIIRTRSFPVDLKRLLSLQKRMRLQ